MKPAKLVVNWLCILTLPLWGGFMILLALAVDAIKGHRDVKDALKGKEWLWKL